MTNQRWPGSARADVSVLDPDGPPGVAFIRALGARSILVDAYGHEPRPAGRASRYLRAFHPSPSPYDTDHYVEWLAGEMDADTIGLVAPTSDYTVFAAAAAMELAGIEPPPGIPGIDAAWSCLHKGEFAERMEKIGFDTVPQRLPTSIDQALVDADELGYPVIVKPRSHVGVGLERGGVVHDADELRSTFRLYDVAGAERAALGRDPDLGWPMLQSFVGGPHTDVVSISGCLGPDGDLWAVGGCRKLAQWPPGAGIGSLFEAHPVDEHVEATIEAVRATLGSGIFELELLIDHDAGTCWPIDLNPRAYGQVALEIARGNDLPALWYRMTTGIELRPLPVPPTRPEIWQSGLTYLPGAVMEIVAGPDRRAKATAFRELMARPRVGSIFDPDDPVPAFALVADMLRHPGSIIRPFIPRRRRSTTRHRPVPDVAASTSSVTIR